MRTALKSWFLSGGASTPYVPQPEYENLVSYWDMDDTTFDIKNGGDNHALMTNANFVNFSTQFGVETTASNSYLSVLSNSNLSFGNGTTDQPFTWVTVRKPTSFSSNKWLLGKRGNTTNAEYQVILIQTTGQVLFRIFSQGGTTNSLSVQTVSGLTLNTEYDIAVTYDGSRTVAGLKIYINGAEQAVTNTSTGTYVAMTAGSENLVFCQQGWTLTTSFGFVGITGRTALFNTALSASKLLALYNSGSFLRYNPDPENDFCIVDPLYVIALNGNYRFSSDGTNLKWSNNKGVTYTDYNWGAQYSGGVAIVGKAVDMGYIFSDGTVIFSCANKLYRSTDGLQTINQIFAKNQDGSNFLIHTPFNAAYPGNFWMAIKCSELDYINGEDFFVWTNYCNTPTKYGAAPVSFWYTKDKGATVKAFYRFGQNPNYEDDGSPDGGSSGQSLGDASNPVICRHGHGWYRIPNTDSWYFSSGDAAGENHIFRCNYDADLDTWEVIQLVDSADPATKWKNTTFHVLSDGTIYFGSDATSGAPNSELGIYYTTEENLGISSTRVFFPGTSNVIRDFKINNANDKLITFYGSSEGANTSIIALIPDKGAGIPKYGNVSGAQSKDGLTGLWPIVNGYWKINVGWYNSETVKTIFIKAT